MWSIVVGTRESSRAQFVRLATPSAGRSFELHRDDISAKAPLVRTRPPSEPSKICVGLDGLTAITCWSGWIDWAAHVHWLAGATPPGFAPDGFPSAHQGTFSVCAANVRSVNVRFTPPPVADAFGSPAVVE